jgi:hypothetical protein
MHDPPTPYTRTYTHVLRTASRTPPPSPSCFLGWQTTSTQVRMGSKGTERGGFAGSTTKCTSAHVCTDFALYLENWVGVAAAVYVARTPTTPTSLIRASLPPHTPSTISTTITAQKASEGSFYCSSSTPHGWTAMSKWSRRCVVCIYAHISHSFISCHSSVASINIRYPLSFVSFHYRYRHQFSE